MNIVSLSYFNSMARPVRNRKYLSRLKDNALSTPLVDASHIVMKTGPSSKPTIIPNTTIGRVWMHRRDNTVSEANHHNGEEHKGESEEEN